MEMCFFPFYSSLSSQQLQELYIYYVFIYSSAYFAVLHVAYMTDANSMLRLCAVQKKKKT